MLFSQALEDRHFTKHESVPQKVAGIIKAQRLIEIAGKQIHFTQREIFFRNVERTQENLDRRVQTRGFYSSMDWLLFVRGRSFQRYVCSPSSTSSPRWLCTVARVVTMPVSPCVVSLMISSWGYSVSPACTSFRNRHEALVNARNTSPMYCGKRVAPGAVKAKTCNPSPQERYARVGARTRHRSGSGDCQPKPFGKRRHAHPSVCGLGRGKRRRRVSPRTFAEARR